MRELKIIVFVWNDSIESFMRFWLPVLQKFVDTKMSYSAIKFRFKIKSWEEQQQKSAARIIYAEN